VAEIFKHMIFNTNPDFSPHGIATNPHAFISFPHNSYFCLSKPFIYLLFIFLFKNKKIDKGYSKKSTAVANHGIGFLSKNRDHGIDQANHGIPWQTKP
jgi:hypothetical protein